MSQPATRLTFDQIPEPIRRHIAWTIDTFEVFRRGGALITYQQVPVDAGNWTGGRVGRGTLVGTNWGVTPQTLAGWRGVDAATITEADMRSLTRDEAVEIGYALFYAGPRLDRLGPFGCAEAVLYDWCWASGPVTAVRNVQRLLGLLDDGRIGPVTAQAWQARLAAPGGAAAWVDAMTDERIADVHAYAAADPRQARFVRLWIERFERFREPDLYA